MLLNELKPGSMLPPEGELMKQFGVSRNTVREALRMLEASGLVKIKQGAQGGAFITRVTNDFVSDFLIKAIRFGEVSTNALSQFRIALEPSIVEMLAGQEVIDADLLTQLDDNIIQVKKLYKGQEVTAHTNMDFHVLLALATGNPMFIILLKTLQANFPLIMTTDFNQMIPLGNKRQLKTIQDHEKILSAVKKRDPAVAREHMHEHLVWMGELFADSRMQRRLSEANADGWEYGKKVSLSDF